MHQSEIYIDNLRRMCPERSSEFVATLISFCGWFIVYGEMDEPVRDELDVFDPSELQSRDEGQLLKKRKVSICCLNTRLVCVIWRSKSHDGTEMETPSLAHGICEFHQRYF